MEYHRVLMESIGYELPSRVVSSGELEERLQPLYDDLHMSEGHLELLTGVSERRWWEAGRSLSSCAAAAGRRALAQSAVRAIDIECLIYTGVCRENFEPATACAVAAELGVSQDANVYDISNACLGMMNGIIDIANRIELQQIRTGMVVSCETSQEIVELMIEHMLRERSMAAFAASLATLTGGSGAAAVLLTDGSFGNTDAHHLLGGVTQSAPEHHRLCRWGMQHTPLSVGDLVLSPDRMLEVIDGLIGPEGLPQTVKDVLSSERIPPALSSFLPKESLPAVLTQFMATDSVAVLKHGVKLGVRTWGSFLKKMGWAREQVDKVICHQVGEGHRDTILEALGIDPKKDFSTYRYLGNIGTVSLPLTVAIAEQRHFLKAGDRVGFLGIGSGLNCLMLGWEW